MTAQFIRFAQLAAGTASGEHFIDLSELQFKFIVKRGDTQTPNSANIRIYNVSRETEAALTGGPTPEFTNVTLIAGYQDNYGLIFSGNIRYVMTGHENATDSFVEIVAADGDAAYNFAFVNGSLAAGSTPADEIAMCQNAMAGVIPSASGGYQTAALSGTAQARGSVLFGMARDHMRVIAKTTGSSWSLQNNQLQVTAQTDVLPDQAIVVNSGTGMIGFPQKTIQGVQVQTLLNPQIKIGSLIKINNADINSFQFPLDNRTTPQYLEQTNQQLRTDADGLYQVLWVETFGDTRGNEWYSDIICVARSADVGYRTNAQKFLAAQDFLVTLPASQGGYANG